jgi:hypothetical protein
MKIQTLIKFDCIKRDKFLLKTFDYYQRLNNEYEKISMNRFKLSKVQTFLVPRQ